MDTSRRRRSMVQISAKEHGKNTDGKLSKFLTVVVQKCTAVWSLPQSTCVCSFSGVILNGDQSRIPMGNAEMYCGMVTTSVYMCLFIYWCDSKWRPIQNTDGKLSKFLTVVVQKCTAVWSLPQSTCVCSFSGVILNGDQSRILMAKMYCGMVTTSVYMCLFIFWCDSKWRPIQNTDGQVEQVSHCCSAEMYCGMVTTSVYMCLFIFWCDSKWRPIQNTDGKLSKFLTVVVQKCTAVWSLPQSTCVCSFSGVILNGDQSRILMAKMYCGMVTTSVYMCLFIFWCDSKWRPIQNTDGKLSKFLTVSAEMYCGMVTTSVYMCLFIFWCDSKWRPIQNTDGQVEQVSHCCSAEMYCGMVTTSVYMCLFIFWCDSKWRPIQNTDGNAEMYCGMVTTSVYMCLFIFWCDSKWRPIQNTDGKLSKFLTVVVQKCTAVWSLPQSTCVCSFSGVILNGDQSRILMAS
ncbi:hypothetical protein J6590_038130 [Homalodisca vitripennis]|nr:hypothetical protein J6590_038130 [Homalodisca vitripennis]